LYPFPAEAVEFLFSEVSQLALQTAQPYTQWEECFFRWSEATGA